VQVTYDQLQFNPMINELGKSPYKSTNPLVVQPYVD